MLIILNSDVFPTIAGREGLRAKSGWYHGTDKFPSEQSGGNFFSSINNSYFLMEISATTTRSTLIYHNLTVLNLKEDFS
jgi:hypothetical protein